MSNSISETDLPPNRFGNNFRMIILWSVCVCAQNPAAVVVGGWSSCKQHKLIQKGDMNSAQRGLIFCCCRFFRPARSIWGKKLHKSIRCFSLCYAETPDKLQLVKRLFTKHRGNAALTLHHLLPATHNLDMVPFSLGREVKTEGLECSMCMCILSVQTHLHLSIFPNKLSFPVEESNLDLQLFWFSSDCVC